MSNRLPPDVTDRLLDRLSSDDEFRDLFSRDPRAALAAVGHAEAADPSQSEGPWVCMHGEGLPSKAQIAQTRDALRERMTTDVGLVIFKLEA